MLTLAIVGVTLLMAYTIGNRLAAPFEDNKTDDNDVYQLHNGLSKSSNKTLMFGALYGNNNRVSDTLRK